MDRPALYISLALYAIAALAPVLFVARTRRFTTALIGGAAALFVIERSIAIFGYLFPSAFGWKATETQVPDAPDTIASLFLSLILALAMSVAGLLMSLFFFLSNPPADKRG